MNNITTGNVTNYISNIYIKISMVYNILNIYITKDSY